MLFYAIIIIVLCILLYLHFYQKWSHMFVHINKIPSPKAYPIIGHMVESAAPLDNHFKQDRKRAIDYYPIYQMWSLTYAGVYLMTPEDIEIVISGSKHLTKSFLYTFLEPWLGTGLLTSTGMKWHSRRKILTPAFHYTILQQFIKIFNNETMKLIETLNGLKHEAFIDVIPLITQLTLETITETSMGAELSMKDSYKNAIYEIGELISKRAINPSLFLESVYNFMPDGRKMNNVIKLLHKFSREVIAERKSKFDKTSYVEGKKLAMLDLLIKAQNEGANIDDEGIREEVDTFMFEGHDTTAVGICYSLLALANNRAIQEAVYEEIMSVFGNERDFPTFKDLQELKYTELVLKECLRMYPSVPLISRTASEDFMTHSGYLIPKGCDINVSIIDLHRNSNIYPDPEKFDPDRFLPENAQKRHPFAYLPFSAGPRNCIGQKYAMFEMKAVISGILKNFILLAHDKPEDIVFETDLVLRTKHGVKIKFASRINKD